MVTSRKVSIQKLLVFVPSIAFILLLIFVVVPGPRELIGAISHKVSHKLHPERLSPTSAATLTPTSTSAATLDRNACTTSAAKGSCGPYAFPQISGINGEVTIGNNVWHPISGWAETLSARNPGDWSVTANLPARNTSVVSYPDVGTTVPWLPNKDANPDLSAWSSIYSSFSVSMPGDAKKNGSVGEAAYDMWLNDWNDEVMIQTDFMGDSLRPRCDVSGDAIATVSFGGSNGVPVQKWKLCQFDSELIWQLPTGTNESSGKVDVMAMLRWLETHGNGKYLPAHSSLTALGFGFELCSTGGRTETFRLNRFSLTATHS
jgi:hypothetical protein